MNNKLTHLKTSGEVQMVNVAEKPLTLRKAKAQAVVQMTPALQKEILKGGPKGEALATARLAGIMAAKRTSEMIPLCHAIGLDSIEVNITPLREDSFLIITTAVVVARTGVEMEAMLAASVSALTLYDMAKALDKRITISDVKLLAKSGGKSGDWQNDAKESDAKA